MAFDLASITQEVAIKAPRIALLGKEKVGKTGFACGARYDEDGTLVAAGLNDPIVIVVKGEEGADAFGVPCFPTCQTYDNIIEAIGTLYTEPHEYRTVVLDSASTGHLLVNDSVCKDFDVTNVRKVPGFRTGEAAVLNKWRGILDGLDALREKRGMASIVIGHVHLGKEKNEEGDDYAKSDFDLDSDIAELIKRWADSILYARRAKVQIKKTGEDTKFSTAKRIGIDPGGERFLCTQYRPYHPGGGRGVYGQLPYELPLDWTAFENAVAEAAAVQSEAMAQSE